MSRRYGWRRDSLDKRDRRYLAPRRILAALPPKIDLRPDMPPVYDQGDLGSCTANAIAAAHEFAQRKQGETAFTPSRLFIYYNERAIEGTVDSDAGAEIRDGIKSVNKQGVCRETQWPYVENKFTRKPPAKCYREASRHQAIKYERISQKLASLKSCIAEGFPFPYGFAVYESFESAAVERTGKVPMPKPDEEYLGGHAVLAVGYDDAKQVFITRNSWGDQWGAGGYFFHPYDYLLDPDLADDFWTIRLVE